MSLSVFTALSTGSSQVRPMSWKDETTYKNDISLLLTLLKPLNLKVPLINVSQSFMPNLSMNTVLSLFGYTSSFIDGLTSMRSSTILRGSSHTTRTLFLMKMA